METSVIVSAVKTQEQSGGKTTTEKKHNFKSVINGKQDYTGILTKIETPCLLLKGCPYPTLIVVSGNEDGRSRMM